MSEVYIDIVVGVKERFEKTGEIDHDALLTAGYISNNFKNINGERSIMVMTALHVFDCTIKTYKARLFSDIRNGCELITKDVLIEANSIKSRMTDDEIKEVCLIEMVTPWTTDIDYDHMFNKIKTGHFPEKGTVGSDIEILYPFAIAETYKLDMREVIFQMVMSYKRGEPAYALRSALDKFFSRSYNEKHLLYRNIIDGSSFDGDPRAYKVKISEKGVRLTTRPNIGASGKPIIQTSNRVLEDGVHSFSSMDDWMTKQMMAEAAKKNEEIIASYLPGKSAPDRGGVMMPTAEKMVIDNAIAEHCKTGLTFKSIIILAAFGTIAIVVFAIFALLPMLATVFSFFVTLIIYAMLGLVFLMVVYILFDREQVTNITMSSIESMTSSIKRVKGMVSPPNPNSIAASNPEIDKTLKTMNANAEQTGEVLNSLWSFGKGIAQGFTKGKKL